MKRRDILALVVVVFLLAIVALPLMRAPLKPDTAADVPGGSTETTGNGGRTKDAPPAKRDPGPHDPYRAPDPTAAPPADAISPSGKAQPEDLPPPVQARTAYANLPRPRFVGGHRANVPPGGALVIGGWRQPDGNRLLMFASPEPQADGETVTIASHFLSIPPSRLAGGGWERFLTDDSVSREGGVFTADEYAAMRKQIRSFTDVDTVSSPRLTTSYGSQAQIMVGEVSDFSEDGETPLISDGVSQGLVARQVEGSDEIELAITVARFVSSTNTARQADPMTNPDSSP